jgi:signal transduction histidine kinase/CheY-like chemotaxis protein/tetratricopeptide (TPR) repeat protein
MNPVAKTERICGQYLAIETIREDAALRILRAVDDQGRPFITYAIDMASVRLASLRARLVYDTERLRSVSVAGVVAPVATDLKGATGYVVCPWIDEDTLVDRLATGQLEVITALRITDKLLSITQDLHSSGHSHLAVRPRDIFISGSIAVPQVQLAGLGSLLTLQAVQSEDTAVQVAAYAAPESLGAIEEDVRFTADLYSIGAVLFECLTGQRPFDGETTGELLFQHMTCPPPDVAQLNPNVPAVVNDIIQRLMKKDPRDRYQSAAGALHDIQIVRKSIEFGTGLTEFVPGTHDKRTTLIEPAFVGRCHESSMLHAELELARSGSDRTVLLTAPSGIGKSRLLLELSRTAARRTFRILRGQGRDQLGLAPLASFEDVFREITELIRTDERIRATATERVRLLQNELAVVLPELGELLGCSSTGSATGDLTDRQVAFALAQVLACCGSEETPILLILDDAQWADDLSLAILECWSAIDSPSTLLLVSTRPTGCSAYKLVAGMPLNLSITLDPLQKEGTRALLESMAGVLPDPVIDTVWEVSEGNPFAAAAVLRGLVEAETLRPLDAAWHFDTRELHQMQMNGQAAEVLKLRLDRLPQEVQDLLAVGAVLGREFSLEAAAGILEVSETDIFELLEDPRRLHLVWVPAGGGRCAFMHDQIRAAVLSALTSESKLQIHYRAADFLVAHYPHRVFEISSHYAGSGRPDLAQPFAMKAASLARSRHSLEIAEEQYRIILSSYEHLQREPETVVLQGIGDVLMLLGRYPEAEPFLQQAVAGATSPEINAQVMLKLGELAFKRDEKDHAIRLWESALRKLGGRIPPAWLMPLFAVQEITVQALHTILPSFFVHRFKSAPDDRDRLMWRIHSRLAYGYWYVRGKAALLWVHLRGMNLAERFAPSPELAQAWSEHGPAMSLVSLNRRGIRYARKSLRIREQLNDLWGQGQSLHFLSIALYSASQFHECIEVGRRSMRILERAGDHWEKLIAQYQVAASHYRLGEFDEAVRQARDAYESGLAIGEEQICGDIIEVWARAAFGKIPQQIVERELNRDRSDVQGNAHVLLAEAVRLSAGGHHDRAVEHLGRGIRTALRAGVLNTYTSPLFAWRATITRLLLETCPPTTAKRCRALRRRHHWYSLQALLFGLWFRNELPHALREYSLSLAIRGSRRRALWFVSRSIRLANRQEAVWEGVQSASVLAHIKSELQPEASTTELETACANVSAFLQSDRVQSALPTSLSLADRFDSLLTDGRRIASAVEREDIVEAAVAATKRMLRCDYCCLLQGSDIDAQRRDGDELAEFAGRVLQEGTTLIDSGDRRSGDRYRSCLGSPVSVRGERVAVLLAANSEISDLFGQNEVRIANYISTITGAALENSESFRRLQDLNANLERIVELRTAAVEARSAELQRTADDLRHTQVELVKARDAAESANQAKTSFLAHMSHEIRTPIGAVLGFAELLATCDGRLEPQQADHVERIQSNGRHLLNLLNDLLDLSRIEAGELSIEILECQPFALVHDVLSAMQSRAVEKGLSLQLKVRNSVPAQIRTDPTRLRQIITNLVGNAIKFTEHGGVIVETELDAEAERLTIHITDSGVGISEEAQTAIFEPFRQADSSVTRRFGGTGLGLSISRKLAMALDGDVTLTSCPYEGSTFSVTITTGSLDGVRLLSAAEADQTIASAGSSGELVSSLEGLRVLVVDDVEENRRFISTVLERAHAIITMACDGREAVESVAEHAYDVIIMDMQMPVLDGYAATSILREAGCSIPVLALTANGMRGDEDRCVAAGCTGYISKPVSIKALLSGISQQIDNDNRHLPDHLPTASGQISDRDRRDIVDGATDLSVPDMTTSPRSVQPLALPTDPFFTELAISFLNKVSAVLPQMKTWAIEENAERLAWHGHWMKGTGGTVGVDPISDYGRKLDHAAKQSQFSTASALIEELTLVVSETLRVAPALGPEGPAN